MDQVLTDAATGGNDDEAFLNGFNTIKPKISQKNDNTCLHLGIKLFIVCHSGYLSFSDKAQALEEGIKTWKPRVSPQIMKQVFTTMFFFFQQTRLRTRWWMRKRWMRSKTYRFSFFCSLKLPLCGLKISCRFCSTFLAFDRTRRWSK